ncbi:MAG: peptidoglycan editing factor PgeF [Lachnospiraceae bacterium]|nr:peptidoglycan editing factor PgeF [Lachnospiraceae bacterium]
MHEYLEKIKNDELPLIKYEVLDAIPFVIHGFTTRLGGTSKGIFRSLNLSFTRGDQKECVRENYKRIAEQIGCDIRQFVASDQTHTTNIRIVSKEDCGKGITKEKDYHDIDGLMTNEPGIVLFTYYADCVPLFFADKVKKVVAVSHSGWRGTVERMGQKTVEKMCEVYGSNKEDIVCAIGPSICQDCYEVSADLLEEFEKKFSKEHVGKIFQKSKEKKEKYQLDLWKANELILEEAGILPQHIENRRICTCCNKEILFSHRGLEGKRGNLAALIGLSLEAK